MKKKLVIIMFMLVTIGIFSYTLVYADSNSMLDGFHDYLLNQHSQQMNTDGINQVKSVRDRVVSVILSLGQMLALTGIVYTGIRYMYLGAKGKSEIKISLMYVAIGCVILFSTTTVVKFILNGFKQVVR